MTINAPSFLQNAQPLKRRRRTTGEATTTTSSISALVWIFILVFVVVVFGVLLLMPLEPEPPVPHEPTDAEEHKILFPPKTDKNNIKKLNKKDPHLLVAGRAGASSEALHHATEGLGQHLRHVVQDEWHLAIQHLMNHSSTTATTVGQIPNRLQRLRAKQQLIGERLREIQQGRETATEILHQQQLQGKPLRDAKKQKQERKQKQRWYNLQHNQNNNTPKQAALEPHKKQQGILDESWSDQPPLEQSEITTFLTDWLRQWQTNVHTGNHHRNEEELWQAHCEFTVQTWYPWEQNALHRLPPRKTDDSLFVSLLLTASSSNTNNNNKQKTCIDLLHQVFGKAAHPERVFVGLVIANAETAECVQHFCEQSDLGPDYCHHVRVVRVESDMPLPLTLVELVTLKLWWGESWFLQFEAQQGTAATWVQDWDDVTISQLQAAPSSKPVLSHIPPPPPLDKTQQQRQPTTRLCGPVLDQYSTIRIEGNAVWDAEVLTTPAFAPFVTTRFFVAHSQLVHEVPRDPFLLSMRNPHAMREGGTDRDALWSSRLWTAGYDIFSPSRPIVQQRSVESTNTETKNQEPSMFSAVQRLQYQLGYPEAAEDVLWDRSVSRQGGSSSLTAVESYSMGTARSLMRYWTLVGLNLTTKQVVVTHWCEHGFPPPGMEQYNDLYPQGMARKRADMNQYMEQYNADDDDEEVAAEDEEQDEQDDTIQQNDDANEDANEDAEEPDNEENNDEPEEHDD